MIKTSLNKIRVSENQKNYWYRIRNQKKNGIKRTFQSDSNNSEQFILFLIWPFLALINCINNRNSSWAKNIFWLFCIYYGYSLIIANEGVDAFRYAQQLTKLSKLDLTISNFTTYLYSTETSYVDILQPLVTFILSRFTSDSRILFATFGMIFGYFYSRNLWYLFDKIDRKISVIIGLYILAFALICPIWNINGFRFWTATQIFLFGTLPYLIDGKRKGIFIAASSVLVHFSFMFPVLLLIIYSFIGNRHNVFFILFTITSFINALDLDVIKNFLSFLPDVFQSRVTNYINKDVYANQLEDVGVLNWYVVYYALFFKLIVYSFLTAIYIKGYLILKRNKGYMNLFCFSLLFYSYCNIVNLMPQGMRFFTVGNLLVFFFIIIYLIYFNRLNVLNVIKIVLTPLVLLIIIVSIRQGFNYTGLLTVFGNPFFTPFINGDFPLIDLIK